jgi:hypothetical protein
MPECAGRGRVEPSQRVEDGLNSLGSFSRCARTPHFGLGLSRHID